MADPRPVSPHTSVRRSASLHPGRLRRRALLLWASLWGVILAGGGFERSEDRVPRMPVSLRIDLNTADAQTLALLPRVGPVLAAAIVADRQRHGLYQTPEALLRVPRLGPVTLQGLLPHVQVGLPAKPVGADEGGEDGYAFPHERADVPFPTDARAASAPADRGAAVDHRGAL